MATGFDKFLSKPLPTTVKPTEHGLHTIIRRWEISAEALRVANADTNAFPAYETPDEEYTSALLVEQSTGDGTAFGVKLMYWRVYQELPANTTDLVQLGKTTFSTTESGLQTAEQRFVARAGHVLTGNVGSDTGGTGTELEGFYLAGRGFAERGRVSAVVVRRWAEPGILDAAHEFGEDGLLYVTFISQGTKFTPTALNATKSLTDIETEAFQGGAAAPVRFSRVRDVNGFRKYTVTVMLQKDGDPLVDDTVVNSRRTWEDYQYPGYVDTSFASGIVPVPGGNIPILVEVTETMTTDGSLTATPAPFSIKQGCYVNLRYIPTETGLAESINKAFGTNFLAGALGLSSIGTTTLLGMEVTGVVAGGGSNPTYSGFLATNSPILALLIVEDFVTDEGVQWYRIRKKTLVGKFGDYL